MTLLLNSTTSGAGSSTMFIIVYILIFIFIIAIPFFITKVLGKTIKECIHEAKKPYEPDTKDKH